MIGALAKETVNPCRNLTRCPQRNLSMQHDE